MQLEDNLWLMDHYYIDRNEAGELRIVGPNNHLYFGAVGLTATTLQLHTIDQPDGEVKLHFTLAPQLDFWPDPAMGHIRAVREIIQITGEPELSFSQANNVRAPELVPNRISIEINEDITTVTYLRTYGDAFYGTKLIWPKGVRLHRDDIRRGYTLEGATGTIELILTTTTSELPELYTGPILTAPSDNQPSGHAEALFNRTSNEINHLVRNGKTSGFDYGTVFPRDYMETADLLGSDLTPEGLRHMYATALKHVDPSGAGWHEDVIGEFAFERQREIDHLSRGFDDFVDPGHPLSPQFRRVLSQLDELFVTRLMIDIEPHYILGLRQIAFSSFAPADQKRLQQVAGFIVRRAQEASLITFNRVATPFRRQRADEYYEAGNWRDSRLAYLQISPIIAPYDVNVVFYPQALRVIRDHASELDIDWRTVDSLITKWNQVEAWYNFTNHDGKPAKALALYDVAERFSGQPDFKQLRINHTDEAYHLFYGTPAQADIVSFCERLLSPDYFYTASGPNVVGRGSGYTPAGYHGEVIWTKQTAYIVRGLEQQLSLPQSANLSQTTLTLMRHTLEVIATTSLKAFETLGDIPELHMDKAGITVLYTDQPHPEGQMNKVQLWSAAGARPILAAAATAKLAH